MNPTLSLSLLLSLSLSLVLLCACSPRETVMENACTFTDDLGRTVSVTSPEKCAVLSSGLAELWMLAGGELFGTSDDTFDRGDIALAQGTKNYGGTHNISTEQLIADGIDFVILSSTASGHRELAAFFESAGIACAYFDVENFDDYLRVLGILTSVTGRDDLYKKNGEDIRLLVQASRERAKTKESPTILLLRAASSFVKARNSDNMTGTMLRELGCTNIADTDNSLLESLSLEAIIKADPDFIFITVMGDYEAGLATSRRVLFENPAWRSLTAVKQDKVFFLPKELFHYKPNARWSEAYGYLEGILYE